MTQFKALDDIIFWEMLEAIIVFLISPSYFFSYFSSLHPLESLEAFHWTKNPRVHFRKFP